MKRVTKTVQVVQIEMSVDEYLATGTLLTQFRLLNKHQNCFYCGIPTPTQAERSIDHYIPRSLGGKFKTNCCKPCNRAKGSMLPEEFRAWRYQGKNIEFFGENLVRRRSRES